MESQQKPIDMVLHCPDCGVQHIDAPEPIKFAPPEFGDMSVLGAGVHGEMNPSRWKNPPHRSHLCLVCGCVWRPADVPTNGVEHTQTKGKMDSPLRKAPQPVRTLHLVSVERCDGEITSTYKTCSNTAGPAVIHSLI